MSTSTKQITILLDLGADSHESELNRSTTQLYQTLLKSDADSVEKLRNHAAEPGAKSAVALTVGAVALTLGAATLPNVIDIIYDWVKRRRINETSVEVQIGDRSMTIPTSNALSEDEYIALAQKMMAALEDKPADELADDGDATDDEDAA